MKTVFFGIITVFASLCFIAWVIGVGSGRDLQLNNYYLEAAKIALLAGIFLAVVS